MFRKLGRALRRLFWLMGLGLGITLLAAVGHFLLAGLDTTTVFPPEGEAPPEPSFTVSTDLPCSPLRYEEVPPYAGEASVPINGNVPYFRAEDAPAESGVFLSELDALGRPGPALALLELGLMPEAERAPIGHIPLAGWHSARYEGLVEDEYLYHRCHLIGYQLCGLNSEKRNLFTGTQSLNVTGMLPYENEAAACMRRMGRHVLYRVTPLYVGNELLARGVQMEALSLEDGGRELQFNAFVYNVQPGITIDYATGNSRAE